MNSCNKDKIGQNDFITNIRDDSYEILNIDSGETLSETSILKILLENGCRVFWNYTHTNQLDSDIQKAKKLAKQYKFSGFIYDGDWENDKGHANAKGTYESAIYEGQWVENKREGQGKRSDW